MSLQKIAHVLVPSVNLVLADLRLQLPLLAALIYYPDKLKELIPDRFVSLIAAPRFLHGLKILAALNVARVLNTQLGHYHTNNWRRALTFVKSQEIVLVTGASSGIGELMALEFAKRGVRVINLDLNPPKNPQPGVVFYQVDITSAESLADVGSRIRKEHGNPTVLINNAGVGYAMNIMDEPVDKIRRTLEVNVFSHFLTFKEFAPAMIKKNHGHIVTIASMAAYVTVASVVDYSCSKAGAVAFHEGIASELRHRYDARNVRTSLVAPSWVRTPMIGPLVGDPTFSDPVLEPEDVAHAVVEQVFSGSSGHVVLPEHLRFVTGVRAWPTWLQQGLRNHFGYLMDVRVRFGGKFKRDPRLDGGHLPGETVS